MATMATMAAVTQRIRLYPGVLKVPVRKPLILAKSLTSLGNIETSIKGDALYGNASDPEAGTIFAIEMSEDDSTGGGLIQLIRIGAGVPAVGNYQLTDAEHGTPQEGDWIAAAYDSDQGQLTAIFAATSGSVKVTRNSNGTYEGTFDFIAIGGALSDPTTEMTIAVNGRFKATQSPGSAVRSLPRVRSR